MADQLRLAMMTFPQSWNGGGTVALNVLLVPSGDPVDVPLIGADPATPSFAAGTPSFEVVVIPSLTGLPSPAAPDRITTAVMRPPAAAVPRATFDDPVPPVAATFAQLKAIAEAQAVTIAPPVAPAMSTAQIRKAIPDSYLAAGGESPNGRTTTNENDFSCAVRPVPPVTTPPGPKRLSWGELLSYALRQPALATSLGLRYALTLELDPAQTAAVAHGGWIFVRLAPADSWNVAAAAVPGSVLVHAARLPALGSAPRTLFAAAAFLVDGAPGGKDAALLAAETYADGFAKLVHCSQPDTADPAFGGSIAPGSDLGIQIGWDDTQVTAWQNDQLALLAARRAGTLTTAPQTPLGVAGYRVDVADVTAPGANPPAPGAWQSLVAVAGTLPAPVGPFRGELSIEPMPIKPASPSATDAWLPKYFANWRGGSLCEADPIPRALTSRTAPPPPLRSADGLTTLLSYGRTYAFRVRLADLSSGGPPPSAVPLAPGPAAIGTQAFVRTVPAKAPVIASDGSPAPLTVTVARPLIGYPEVLYTALGATEAARTTLREQLVTQAQNPATRIAGVPDPDIDRFSIDVEVAHPLHDVVPAAGGDSRERVFALLYRTSRPFANLSGEAPLFADPGTKLDLAYVAAPSIAGWPDTFSDSGPVIIPRGRDVRLVIRGVTRSTDPSYFAPQALQGHPARIAVRAEATGETPLLIADPATPKIRGLAFRRPAGVAAPPVVEQLAVELRVASSGDRLTAPPGTRTLFGCSKALRHELSADGETLTFAATGQLLGQWIVAIVVDLPRDWTWDGLSPQGITVFRGGPQSVVPPLPPGGGDAATSVGSLTVPGVLGAAARTHPQPHARGSTRLIFLDAVDPHEATSNGFPDAAALRWFLVPNLRPVPVQPPLSAPAGTPPPPPGGTEVAGVALEITLPIVLPPAQVPALASVGVALSPYQIGAGYASTLPRTRGLWLELKAPIANALGDALFARVIGHGADPLLYASIPQSPANTDPPLGIDPELLRVVFPGDSDDRAGIDAMVQLDPSPDSDRHFLLPLPPGVDPDDPELFGFYTYELRIGHAGPAEPPPPDALRWWSTANGRFGPPLRVVGVQHPAPALHCDAGRIGHPAAQTPKIIAALRSGGLIFNILPVSGAAAPAGPTVAAAVPNAVVASSTYATPVFHGQPLTAPFEPPTTTLWFFLYAQAVQMDGASMRNILLATAKGVFLGDRVLDPSLAPLLGGASRHRRDRVGFAVFEQAEIDTILATLRLPATAPLSILAVELLPGGGSRGIDPSQFGIASVPGRFPFGRILRASPLRPIAPYC